MAEKDPLNLIVAGVGGQGNVLLSKLLAKAFVKKGYNASIGETYGGSQRGGAVMSHVRVSSKRACGPLIPEGKAHIILGLEPMETMRMLSTYGNPEVAAICNIRPIHHIHCIVGLKDYPEVEELKRAIVELTARQWFLDATQISLEMGNPILLNMVMIGALIQTNLVNLSKSDLEVVMREAFTDRKAIETNMKALDRGLLAVSN